MEFLKTLSEIRTPLFDNIFSVLTRFGEETFVILILCIIYWCVNKRTAYIIGTVYFISGLLVQGMKITFRVPRPWVLDPSFKAVEAAVPGATGYSFPSGHTQSAAALYGSVGILSKRRAVKAVCLFLALTIPFSRMYLGVHTPADVLTSLFLTVAIILFIFGAEKYRNKKHIKSSPTAVSLIMLAVCGGLIFYSLYMFKTASFEKCYVTDCCKAAGAGMGFAAGYFIEKTYVNFSEKASKPYYQVLKLLIGLLAAVILKSGIKVIFGESLLVSVLRYFVVVFWVIALWPMIFSRFSAKKKDIYSLKKGD